VHEDKKYFSVMGVHVRATSREVSEWSQPMLAPVGRGAIAFLGRHVNGLFHLLVQARTEAGTQDVVEMSPTVKCIPENYADVPRELWPRYLDVVQAAPAARILVDVVHSEEGGRFFHAESRYLVVDVGEEFDLDVPDDFCWMTVEQLTGFVRYGNHVNVEARCLLSCLTGAPSRQPSVIG
jgi:oxidase EvaA